MIDVDIFPMSIGSITLTSNIQRKNINNIYFPLLSFIQPHEQGGILRHVMSAHRLDYSFIMCRIRQQGVRSSKLEGEIISGSTFRRHISFQEFNTFL
jgi:hypothetical protein